MKYIFTLLALCCALLSYAQKYEYKGIQNFPVSAETGKVSYDSVVTVESKTAKELYTSAKEWIALNYPNAKEVIQQDKPNSQLIGRGSLNEADGSVVLYKFILDFKDGKYRYQLTNLTNNYTYNGRIHNVAIEESIKPTMKTNAKHYDSQYAALNKQMRVIAESFAAITLNTQKKDW